MRNKKNILKENQKLKELISKQDSYVFEKEYLFDENIKLKEIFFRKQVDNLILGTILSKSNRSLYGNLIIDIGEDHGLMIGNKVFADGNILIGEILEVYTRSSKVKLYSTPGNKIDISLGEKSIFLEMTGIGSGGFVLDLPKDFEVKEDEMVVVPSLNSYPVGIVSKVSSDPRDPSLKVYIKSLVNTEELRFVQVLKNNY